MAATDAGPEHRIEIVGERRRMHDAAFRGRVVAEACAPGASVREVARRHGICPSLIYRWRRVAASDAAHGAEPGFVPVRVTPSMLDLPRSAAVPVASAEPRPSGRIEIELAGGVRVRVDEAVSLSALRRVLGALRG